MIIKINRRLSEMNKKCILVHFHILHIIDYCILDGHRTRPANIQEYIATSIECRCSKTKYIYLFPISLRGQFNESLCCLCSWGPKLPDYDFVEYIVIPQASTETMISHNNNNNNENSNYIFIYIPQTGQLIIHI